MASLNLEIITADKALFKGEITSISIPGVKGRFQVLKNHAPLISIFEIGMIEVVTPDSKSTYYAAAGGTVEVLNNNVLVLADSLEPCEKIDVERAKKALQRAQARIAQKAEGTDLERAENALKRAINRINIVEKYLGIQV
jgi:F-type H+-transporting ATPase subunit epsilon